MRPPRSSENERNVISDDRGPSGQRKRMRTAETRRREADRDTMSAEYDFAMGERGVTAARFAQGANMIVIDPDVLDVFPDGASANEALRALAPSHADPQQGDVLRPPACVGLPGRW
jgi:hypothetical protein